MSRGRRSDPYHSGLTFPVQVGPASITINRDDRFLICQPGRPDPWRHRRRLFTHDTRWRRTVIVSVDGELDERPFYASTMWSFLRAGRPHSHQLFKRGASS
jgi:hypothetical protein